MAFIATGETAFGDFPAGNGRKNFRDCCGASLRYEYGGAGFGAVDPNVLSVVLFVAVTEKRNYGFIFVR